MAIKEWWAGDEKERFWLEITDRDKLGEDLHCPQEDQAGNETWGWTLVGHVRPGDIVFHYWKRFGKPRIVGYSKVAGKPYSRYMWYGGDKRDCWLAPLKGFRELSSPITLSEIRSRESDILRVRDKLETVHGKPVYFPFVSYAGQSIRPAQAYVAKMPREFLALFPEASATGVVVAGTDEPDIMEEEIVAPGAALGGAGHQQDLAVRKALERHAVDRATKWFESLGYTVEDVGKLRPYDLLATNKESNLHVEAKGTATKEAMTVELTDGEVRHARSTGGHSALFVVDGIQWVKHEDGQVDTSGGRSRLWSAWRPASKALKPTQYEYTLSGGWEAC